MWFCNILKTHPSPPLRRPYCSTVTKRLGTHHDFDDFTTYDLTTFTTPRLVIDLETGLEVQK
jgi:hypothetical protein